MDYLKKYTSNSCAGSGNQTYFTMDDGEIRTGRLFYKIFASGEYNYSILFSNIIDSTYADGTVSRKNMLCDVWKIHSARIGKCDGITGLPDTCDDIPVYDFKEITFDGKKQKNVKPGELFASDHIMLCFEKGQYLCLEITFSGKRIPYHEESLLPVYINENGKWKYSKYMPFAGRIGAERKVKVRVGYLGDSITQGIGTPGNSYLHWNALLSDKIGEEYSFWNLGIGYGRANDAASDGAWLYKAKQNDIVFVCYGVNDILNSAVEEQIKSDLAFIVDTLKKAGITVVLQTIPPFDYTGENIGKWERLNLYIKTELKDRVDAVFDVVPYLGKEGSRNIALYGGHPDSDGCGIWADALYEQIKYLF